MIWKPHVTVAAIIERDARFLMIEETVNGKLVVNQPAGHLEQNETLSDAVVRETLEESAWHFTPTQITGIYQWTAPKTSKTFLRVCYTGHCDHHDPGRELDDGIIRALWLTRDEITRCRLRSPMVLQGIDDYLAGQRYPLHLFRQL
jgi:ADP-ribose pyrophosphatase YjhB (NUDIX family)